MLCLYKAQISGERLQDHWSLVIIISSIFKEDNIFSMTANLPYGPPMNTENDYYQTFFSIST